MHINLYFAVIQLYLDSVLEFDKGQKEATRMAQLLWKSTK